MEPSTARLALDLDELAVLLANRELRVQDLTDAAVLCRGAADRLRELATVIRDSAELASKALADLDHLGHLKGGRR